ncbi:MAG: DUF1778 domain-containing protein [Bifidobacteriaceae bacterium]|jgi:uncharacterized protein (DUF1778 family)|nr:DUF1778 domain-containing protein [Bifidobacteriaceae bacterium]
MSVTSARKTHRLEARADEHTFRVIGQAAELLHTTKTAFITDTARREAERVLARSDVTLMAPAVFDALVESLDQPDDAPELAQRLARLPRII